MFHRITIIGLGVIGASLCKAIKRYQPEAQITGIDLPEIVPELRKTGLADRVFSVENLRRHAGDAQLIILATPIQVAVSLLPRIALVTSKNCTVIDVCSLKTEIVGFGEQLFTGRNGWFIGGHPMAGREGSGYAFADGALFQNTCFVLCPAARTPRAVISRIQAFVRRLGARPMIMEPAVHDRIAAAVSHLPQMLATTLMYQIARKAKSDARYLQMAAGGFRDMTRIAGSSFSIWRDICAGNRDHILAEIDEFIDALRVVRQALQEDALAAIFAAAAAARAALNESTEG